MEHAHLSNLFLFVTRFCARVFFSHVLICTIETLSRHALKSHAFIEAILVCSGKINTRPVTPSSLLGDFRAL